MPSVVDIANEALNIIGANTISALDENSKAAIVVNQRYSTIRDSVFRDHPWNCLMSRATLAQDTETPDFGYTYQYTLPTLPYCLRVLEFSNGTSSYPQDNMTNNTGGPVFVVEGRKLLTDEGTVKIRYIARVEDPNEYDASLIDALAAKIATEICYSITGSASLVNTTFQLYQQKLSVAKNVDATEGAPQRIEASDFIESRF